MKDFESRIESAIEEVQSCGTGHRSYIHDILVHTYIHT